VRAVVVGGGIGGLAAAVALRRIGAEVELYERAPEIGEVGAGLSLWSNAVHALRRLGVVEQILAAASPFDTAITYDARGRVLSELSLRPFAAAEGEPSVGAHRAELQRALAAALEPAILRTGKACVGVEAHPGWAEAQFADGSLARGDVVVGADGIRSAVRAALLGAGEPRHSGYAAWRGIARMDHPALVDGRTLFLMGRGAQAGLFPCGPGRTYWFLTRNGPAGAPAPADLRAAALEVMRAWPAPFREVAEATEPAALLWNDIVDRPPARDWGRGRVTLLGDAIHPTTPNLGQGACMALEDAVVLAASLRAEPDVERALRRYEDERRARAAFVQERSWRLGRMFQWEHPLLCWIRDRASASTLGRREAEELFRTLLVHRLPELS
jgi:FAD-dependent urate hydroxylase